MFSAPRLLEGEYFPGFDLESAEATELFSSFGAPTSSLAALQEHALNFWVGMSESDAPRDLSVDPRETARYAGLIAPIVPTRDSYDYMLLDGGSKPVFDYRLNFVDTLRADGLLSGMLVVFGGQRLRDSSDDKTGTLEERAARIARPADRWARHWLTEELAKDPTSSDPWARSFATEHEAGLLALIERYGDRLKHVDTNVRRHFEMAGPHIPLASVHSEEFDLEGMRVLVLNGQAVIREFSGERFPSYRPRPTARSCFYDWIRLIRPQFEASTLVISHNPNIYRTWLDILLGMRAINRQDLDLEAAGAAIEPDRSVAYLFNALGRLVVNFYNYSHNRDGAAPVLEPATS